MAPIYVNLTLILLAVMRIKNGWPFRLLSFRPSEPNKTKWHPGEQYCTTLQLNIWTQGEQCACTTSYTHIHTHTHTLTHNHNIGYLISTLAEKTLLLFKFLRIVSSYFLQGFVAMRATVCMSWQNELKKKMLFTSFDGFFHINMASQLQW